MTRPPVELYKDRRENWLKDEIYDVKKAMDAEIVQYVVLKVLVR